MQPPNDIIDIEQTHTLYTPPFPPPIASVYTPYDWIIEIWRELYMKQFLVAKAWKKAFRSSFVYSVCISVLHSWRWNNLKTHPSPCNQPGSFSSVPEMCDGHIHEVVWLDRQSPTPTNPYQPRSCDLLQFSPIFWLGPHSVISFPSMHTRCHNPPSPGQSLRLILRFQGNCITEQLRSNSFFVLRSVSGNSGHLKSWHW